jgi:hypothetical protein
MNEEKLMYAAKRALRLLELLRAEDARRFNEAHAKMFFDVDMNYLKKAIKENEC